MVGTVNAITGVTAAELDLTDTGTVTQTQRRSQRTWIF